VGYKQHREEDRREEIADEQEVDMPVRAMEEAEEQVTSLEVIPIGPRMLLSMLYFSARIKLVKYVALTFVELSQQGRSQHCHFRKLTLSSPCV
jgi:hypothetical protein